MTRVLIGALLFSILTSCKGKEAKELDKNDTTKVLIAIFDSKELVKEFSPFSDSLYLIKNKYYHKSWPHKTKHFTIAYLEDTPPAKMVNLGQNDPSDNRQRLEVLKIGFKADTVNVLMIEHGSQLFFNYSLKAENSNWLIVKQRIEVGGRRTSYGFTKEKWYLDLKKKLNGKKNMDVMKFPPKNN